MKKGYTDLLTLFVLTLGLTTFGAETKAGTICKFNRDEAPKVLTRIAQNAAANGRRLPGILLDAVEVSVSDLGDSKQRFALEGFMRLRPGFYRLLPKLGAGVDIKGSEYVYFCAQGNQSSDPNFAYLAFLSPSRSSSTTYELARLKIDWKPAKNGVLIWDSVMSGVSGGFKVEPLLPDFLGAPFDAALKVVYGTEVLEVYVEPRQSTITYMNRVLGINAGYDRKTIPFDATGWIGR